MSLYKLDKLKPALEQLRIELIICSASFEDRSFKVPEALPEAGVATSFICFNSNEERIISENAVQLEKKFKSRRKIKIELNTDNPVENYFRLIREFERYFGLEKRSNILLETTTFTHETLLVILRILLLYKQNINKLYISYVGASKYSYNIKNDNEKWLSLGIKDIRTIIGYPGSTDPTQKNHLIILFGFESERTKNLIEYYEFDKVSLGFANKENSIQKEHQIINENRHKQLIEEYKSNNQHMDQFEFSLVDPIVTKNQILDLVKKNPNYNTVIAPMNNKISTVGAGLAAIENSSIQIAYARANLYNHTAYSKAGDEAYVFQLEI